MDPEADYSGGVGENVNWYAFDWLADLGWSSLPQGLEYSAMRIWEILQVPGSEFWSAIIGAVVGGVIAFRIQNKALTEARKERQSARLQAEQALAYSLLFKVIKIYNSLEHIRRHVDMRKTLHGGTTTPSGYLLALANLPSAIEFSADEMSMLLSLQIDDIFNRTLTLDSIHNSIIPAWELYSVLRGKVQSLSEARQFDPNIGKSEIAVRKDSPLAIAVFEADQMAMELQRRAYLDAKEAKQVLQDLATCFREKFEFKFDIVDADRTVSEQAAKESAAVHVG